MKDFKDKLPKTQKQWLHFASKVQAKINKIYKEYAKDVSIKDWLKKFKNIEPKYYSVDVNRRRSTGIEIPSEPKDQRSFQVIYEKDGLMFQRTCFGMDEGDIRDRGNYYIISFDGIAFSYQNYIVDEPFKHVFFRGLESTIKVNGIELKAKIDGWLDSKKEFHFESEDKHYNGIIDGRKIEVYISLKKAPMDYRPLYVLKCMRRKPRYSVAEQAAMELMREFGRAPIASDLTKQGYRYREDIEADPE